MADDASGKVCDQPYVPVACAFHERLEFAVLRKLFVELEWSGSQGLLKDRVFPLDVQTRNGAEWLTCRRASGEVTIIRLDCIHHLLEIPPARLS